MSDASFIAMVDANLAAFGRHLGRSTPGGGLDERADVLLVAGSDPTPVIVNSAFAIGAPAVASSILPAAAEFFGRRGHGYGLWTRAHADLALEAVLPMAGFHVAIELPVMIHEGRLETRPVPAGAEIRPVLDATGVDDFRAADRAGFAADEDERAAVDSAFGDPGSLLDPAVAAFVAYVDGVPAAAALSFTAVGVARVGWVGTVPEFRRRGLGDAVTRAAALAGFDRGASIAALEASPVGEPLYRAMGFREITRYRVWTIS